MSWVMVAVLAAAPAVLDVRGGALEVREGDAVQRLSLGQLTRDGWSCSPALEARSDVGPRVVQARACGVRETFTDVSVGLEHEVVLSTRPGGRGPLRVRLDVEGGWLGAEGGAQRFGGPGLDGWRYGAASLVRPEGLVPLETRRVPGGLEVIVPEGELARPDAFPLHIDPLVARGSLLALDVDNRVTPSAGDESAPALAFSLDGTHFLALWSDTRRATNFFGPPESDIYLALVDPLDGGRLELSKGDPGVQDRPVVSAVDGGFIVAWEDKRFLNEVKVGFVARSPDAGALVLTGLDSIPGNSPALAPMDPMRGVVLAFVPPAAQQTVALRVLGGLTLTSLNMGFNVAQVSVAAVNSDVWLAATDGISQSKLFKNTTLVSDQLGGDHVQVVLDSSGASVLVKNPTFGSPLAGVRLFRFNGGSGQMEVVQTFAGHIAPAWTPFMGGSVVGAVSGGQLTSSQSPFMSVTNTTLALTSELALAGSSDTLVAAYTTGPVGDRDLVWRILLSPQGALALPAPLAQTRASLRRNARVAFNGDRGLAVWLSNREVRGRWLTRPMNNGEISLGQPFTLTTASSALGAVDLAFRNNGSAVVAWSSLGVGGSQLNAQAWPLDAMTSTAPTFTLTTGALVTALDVESAGAAVYAAWKDGTAIRAAELLGGTSQPLFSTVTASATFDLACSPELVRCLAVVESGSVVRTNALPNPSAPATLSGNGPVAALMSNGKSLVVLRRGLNFEVVDAADPTVVLETFPIGASEPRSVVLAGDPVVLAVSDFATTPPLVQLGAMGDGVFALQVPAAWNPDVALSLGGQGMLVVTQDDSLAASTTVTAQRFQLLPRDAGVDAGVLDAGVPDAGVLDAGAGADAGTLDAGPGDAGVIDAGVDVDAGVSDGGVGEPFAASGCTCDALSGAWATWLVLAWAVRRRR